MNAEKVTDLDLAKVGAWPRLDSLLPATARRYGTWTAITGIGTAGAFELKKPGATYGALVPALYPDPATKQIHLGLFDPVDLANKGAPKVHHDGLTELRVMLEVNTDRGQNDHMGGEVADPATIKIAIEGPGTTTELTGPQLLALPRQAAPDDSSGEQKGWTLMSILAAANIKQAKRVLLTGEELNLTLEEADLDPKLAVPFIKLNRQGSLRFRTYRKEGAGWTVGGDLRGLHKIQVLK
ncbi:MAG TPA: hypothetical protein PKU97_04420 [Kofleriaceae bacterium]|nr:hypothetical protein [Kofleriaceae bacterium]